MTVLPSVNGLSGQECRPRPAAARRHHRTGGGRTSPPPHCAPATVAERAGTLRADRGKRGAVQLPGRRKGVLLGSTADVERNRHDNPPGHAGGRRRDRRVRRGAGAGGRGDRPGGRVLLGARPVFFFNDTATTEIYTLSLHDALPISQAESGFGFSSSEWLVTISPPFTW